MEKIIESKLEIKEDNFSIRVTKQIYVNCICDSFNHVTRWIVEKYVTKSDGLEDSNIYYEIKNYPKKNNFLKRIIIAIKILIGKDIYTQSDFVWSFDTIERFYHTINNTVKEVKEYKTGYEKKEKI